MKNIDLGQIKVQIEEYASQGNAILGIRDSGKSYTATAIAERLMDAGIPIIAFDPIGIWRYLRVPGAGKGYEVVVAGGKQGDLPLTARGAQEIVRAAMRANVSLVVDLYDIHLSKADWRAVVGTSIRTLLYENGEHGLRHIFIEEAAEFVPQNIGDQQGQVYAEVEKLARMGGNALLGYTLINQRAEQVNKAVLELCDCLILHRQKGRNSINALTKWLDIAAANRGNDVARSLPGLAQGECWVWPAGSDAPVRTKIPQKHSFHPDRRARQASPKGEQRQVDVSAFVGTMKGTLDALVKEAEANDPKLLRAQIASLRKENAALRAEHSDVALDPKAIAAAEARAYERGQANALRAVKDSADALGAMAATVSRTSTEMATLQLGLYERAKALPAPRATHTPQAESHKSMRMAPRAETPQRPAADLSAVGSAKQRILDALAWLEAVGIDRAEKVQLALLADQSPKSSGYTNNLGALRSAGLIEYPGPGQVELTPAGRRAANAPERPPTTEDLHRTLELRLPAPQWRILKALISYYPESVAKSALAAEAGQSATSSGYTNNLGALRSLGFIDYPQPGEVAALPVLFLER